MPTIRELGPDEADLLDMECTTTTTSGVPIDELDYDDGMSLGSAGDLYHDDDDDDDDDCTYCTCDKHKKILSFMDACVKLGFQLLSSDFEKSFKPLQNAFNSGQKTTPIKQLNGVALSVKRVCNYALEQSAIGYIEKFKKFIQKEMDTESEHIEFLIEMHFEMKENFDCYCKNFTVLLAIATQLNPAYDDAVLFKVNTKCFKDNQAIERFLKTQEDIKAALVHYEKVLEDIKERFEENHPNLYIPDVPKNIRSLMNGSLWVSTTFLENEKDLGDLGGEEKVDFSLFDFEQKTSPSSISSSSTHGITKNRSSTSAPAHNCNSELHKHKKLKKKVTKCNNTTSNCNGEFGSDKRLAMVTATCVNSERGFYTKTKSILDSISSNKKLPENCLNTSRDRSESSSRYSNSPRNSVDIETKLKNSCQKRGFECCFTKTTNTSNACTAAITCEEPSNTKKKNRQKKNTESSESISDVSENGKNFSLSASVESGLNFPTGFLKRGDFVDDFDGIGIEELSEFITVNNKRTGGKNGGKSGKNGGGSAGAANNDSDSSKDKENTCKKSADNPALSSPPTAVSGSVGIGEETGGSGGKNRIPRLERLAQSYACSSLVEVLPPQTAISPPENTLPNSMTISQKLQAFMSLDPSAGTGVNAQSGTGTPSARSPPIVQSSLEQEKKTQFDTHTHENVIAPDNSAITAQIRASSTDNLSTDNTKFTDNTNTGVGGVFPSNFLGPPSKPKPISKPIATVDPCKHEPAKDVIPSVCENSSSLFTESSFTNESRLNHPFQNYSPLDGSDRLRPVQDSMAKYTNNSSNNTNSSEDSKVPGYNVGSSTAFSAFNDHLFSGIFPPPSSHRSESNFSSSAPGFDSFLAGFSSGNSGKGDLDKDMNNPMDLSNDLDLRSNLNPTANVFNPQPRDSSFFPSATPPGGFGGFPAGLKPPAGSSNGPFGGTTNMKPRNNVIPTSSLGIDQNTGKIDRDSRKDLLLQDQTFKVKSSGLSHSRNSYMQTYKNQMHLSVRLINAEINDTKSRCFLLKKLEGLMDYSQKQEIDELLTELNSRYEYLLRLLDRVYGLYKQNLLVMAKANAIGCTNYEQFPAINVEIPVLSSRVHKFFSS